MHHVGQLADSPVELGVFAGRSEGYTRRPIIGDHAGSVHQEVVIAELAPGGRVEGHLHAFEEGLFVLSGELSLRVDGDDEQLTADDYCFIEKGVAHELVNPSASPVSWLEVNAPQPGGALEDTVFGAPGLVSGDVDLAYRRDRFQLASLPAPSATIGLAGFGGANVGGAALEMLIGPDFGASQFNLMVVQYAPGGFITRHDHAFEEGFFFLEGEIEADLDGDVHTLPAGSYCWSGVGSMHGLANRSDHPVRWLETQVPQPPRRHQARFTNDWDRLVGNV